MARGNQRDKSREKSQKAKADAEKGQRKDGLSYKKFQEQNAELMRQKQIAGEAKKAAAAASGGGAQSK